MLANITQITAFTGLFLDFLERLIVLVISDLISRVNHGILLNPGCAIVFGSDIYVIKYNNVVIPYFRCFVFFRLGYVIFYYTYYNYKKEVSRLFNLNRKISKNNVSEKFLDVFIDEMQ